MKHTFSIACALTLSLALAACGQPADDSDTAPAETAAPEATPAETAAPATDAAADAAQDTAAAVDAAAAGKEPVAFIQCKACHSTKPGEMKIGPSLAGVYGTKAGEIPGYQFSTAMKESGLTWDDATLDKYLTDPKAVVPGTKMTFFGLKDEAKRKEVIAYLKSLT
ncbi:c-type cytochrome [Tsuneonella suprasediminis]|uniref:c-type cytochrome n=1 Tax=Tsuneonella suprasediminis TaxID=2306996 RepID=UPI002F92ABEC